jgi:endonuclease/exonuclease/phosphatase (EEP) superfamily protein YafD
MPDKRSVGRGVLRAVCLVLILTGAALSFLPLFETNAWWVRYTDFIRLQLAVLLAAAIVIYLAAGGARGWPGVLVAALGVGGLGYHAYRFYPYLGILDDMAVAAGTCTDDAALRIMVANVQKSNEHRDALLEIVVEADPDLLLLLETDRWWNQALEPIAGRYPEVAQYIPEARQAFGMHLLSRFPLKGTEVLFWFGAETPSIRTNVLLPSGEPVGFLGIHPQPPLYWSQPTTLRDAHLLRAAIQAAQSPEPSILAGDFNAVPWERISRRAMRIGQLLDPRVGRGIYPTYDAQSWIMSWPLDQILFQQELGLMDFERLPDFGSDHYPILAELCLTPGLADRQSAPAIEPGDLAEAAAAIAGARDAR